MLEQVGRVVRSPVPAFLLLLCAYGVLSFALDPDGYLGTDTGAKVVTLEVMAADDTTSPDIGYWAEDLDPDGSLHPVYQTRKQPDGSWVAVTTLPMLEAAVPLYDWGGYRATLILPMLGGAFTAVAARFVARRIDPGSDGWGAYWLVGLASPIVLYALDFWEHSLGVACIVGAVAVLLGILDQRPAWTAVFAGLLLGVGATLRNETLVYALASVGTVCVTLVLRRRLRAAVETGIASVVGFAGPWFANLWLESAVEGQSRTSRATSAASSATGGGSGSLRLGERFEEGLQTLLGLVSGDAAVSVLLGAGVVVAVVVAIRAERRDDLTFAKVGLGLAASVYIADAIGGLGFVPGLLVAFPVTIAALVLRDRNRAERTAITIAVVALPIVYLFMYLGGASPQWGGRYTLASAILLGVVGLRGLTDRLPVVGRGLLVLTVGVTALGMVWMVERTHSADDFFDELVAEAEPIVIARQAFLLREAGEDLSDRRWLSTADEGDFQEAIEVVRAVGEERFTVLEWDGVAPPPTALPDDVEEVDRDLLHFVDTPVGVVTYAFTG